MFQVLTAMLHRGGIFFVIRRDTCLKRFSDFFRCCIQLRPSWPLEIFGTEFQSKTIPFITRKHVQMNVENFLHGCFAIGQKQIHAFALQTAFPQRRREPLGDSKDMSAGILIKVSQKRRMRIRNNHQMPGIHRLNIHACRAAVILENDARLQPTGSDFAKAARVHQAPIAELMSHLHWKQI